jgi:hypothetical protein
MIYTHVLNRGGLAVRSPLDQVASTPPRPDPASPAEKPRPTDLARLIASNEILRASVCAERSARGIRRSG